MQRSSSRLLGAVALIAILSGPIAAPASARPGNAGGAARSQGASRTAGATSKSSHHHSAARNGTAANANQSTHGNRGVHSNRSANVNVNHNVNVSHNGGGYGYGRHPVARAATVGAVAVTTGAVIGSMYRTLPSNCATVIRAGGTYHHCGSAWYQSHNGEYVAVVAP